VESEFLTVRELAEKWKCSATYIYRRLRPGHPQSIPHRRTPSGDIRFDPGMIESYLKPVGEGDKAAMLDSAVRGGVKMTRRRDRQGSLRIKDGSWCVQWTEGNRRPSHSLGRVKDLTKSEAQKLKREWMKKLNDRREVAGNSRSLAGIWREHFYDEEKQEAKHELKDKRPSTVRDMKWVMKQIWLPRFGARLLDGLGAASYRSTLTASSSRGRPPRSTVPTCRVSFHQPFDSGTG
jgi:hypothetical protein